MSVKNGVLTHELKHKKSGDVLFTGNKMECEQHLRASVHKDIHGEYEISKVDHFGSGDMNLGLRQKDISKNPELPKTHADAIAKTATPKKKAAK